MQYQPHVNPCWAGRGATQQQTITQAYCCQLVAPRVLHMEPADLIRPSWHDLGCTCSTQHWVALPHLPTPPVRCTLHRQGLLFSSCIRETLAKQALTAKPSMPQGGSHSTCNHRRPALCMQVVRPCVKCYSHSSQWTNSNPWHTIPECHEMMKPLSSIDVCYCWSIQQPRRMQFGWP